MQKIRKLLSTSKLLLIDVDGTAADFYSLYGQIMERKLLEKYPKLKGWEGKIFSLAMEQFSKEKGIGAREVIRRVLLEFNICPEEKELEEVYREYRTLVKKTLPSQIRPGHIHRGFKEFIEGIDKDYAFVTSTLKAVVEALIMLLPKPPVFFIAREDVEEVKPRPEAYIKALEKSELGGNEVVVFEDSLAGRESALKAGIPEERIICFAPFGEKLWEPYISSWEILLGNKHF